MLYVTVNDMSVIYMTHIYTSHLDPGVENEKRCSVSPCALKLATEIVWCIGTG